MTADTDLDDLGYRREDLPRWAWLWVPVFLVIPFAVLPHLDREFYRVWVMGEQRGVIEGAQVVLLITALVISLRALVLPTVRSSPWLFLWFLLAAVCCFYVAGEEASWGQHYLGWQTPEAWKSLNDQDETNLHNVSSWLDQKPRVLLELGVVVGGIVIPLWRRVRPDWNLGPFDKILPPILCLPTAVLSEIVRFPERLSDMAGLKLYYFGRASEIQEFYFYLFVLLYLIVLRRRVEAR